MTKGEKIKWGIVYVLCTIFFIYATVLGFLHEHNSKRLIRERDKKLQTCIAIDGQWGDITEECR